MNALDLTLRILATFAPEAPLEVERHGTAMHLKPTDGSGFPVSMYDEGESVMISAERWHSHYDDPEQAAWCAYWLLSPYYRVVHELKGGVLVAVWYEAYSSEGWEGHEPVYFLNPEYPPDWELEEGQVYVRRIIQPSVVPSPQPFAEIEPGAALDEDGLPQGSVLGVSLVTGTEPIGPRLFEG